MDTFLFIFSDYIWLPLLEFAILFVFIRSKLLDNGAKLIEGSTGAKITRWEKSWQY